MRYFFVYSTDMAKKVAKKEAPADQEVEKPEVDIMAEVEKLQAQLDELKPAMDLAKRVEQMMSDMKDISDHCMRLDAAVKRSTFRNGPENTPLTMREAIEHLEDNPKAMFRVIKNFKQSGVSMTENRTITKAQFPQLVQLIGAGLRLVPCEEV